jgi:hypothetical protein
MGRDCLGRDYQAWDCIWDGIIKTETIWDGIKCRTITPGTKTIWDGTFIRYSPQP